MVFPTFKSIVPNNLAAQDLLELLSKQELEPLLISNLFIILETTIYYHWILLHPPLWDCYQPPYLRNKYNYYYMTHSSRGSLKLRQILRTF